VKFVVTEFHDAVVTVHDEYQARETGDHQEDEPGSLSRDFFHLFLPGAGLDQG
jgi:hypothetical protein